MNEIEDRLAAAVRPEAGFDSEAVAGRVAVRRRRRQVLTGAAAVVLVVGVGLGITALIDDDPDVDVAGDDAGDDAGTGDDGSGDDGDPAPIDDTQPPEVVLEDPVGADGETGAASTTHVLAESPFQECESLGRPGPATGEEYARQEALWQAFSDDFVAAEWPFVAGFGGPENVWGRVNVLLSRPDADTFGRLLEYYDPDTLCVELPPAELVPPVPADVPWGFVDEPATGDTSVRVVELLDCATKATGIETWVVEFDERIEVGIQAWSEPGTAFTDDCPLPAEYTIELPSPVDERPIVVAATRPLLVDGPVAAGDSVGFTIAPHNLAGLGTTGDDLLARHVEDPAVRFQVSDVFTATPIAGEPRAVALDRWPATGGGTIRVPADVPAGTYTIQFLDHPQLNGRLTITSP